MRQRTIDGILVTKPTRTDVQSLTEDDLAPDCFGSMRRVTRVYARGDDIHGKAYVCYYVEFGEASGSTISESLKEDEILSTDPLTRKWKQARLVPWVN